MQQPTGKIGHVDSDTQRLLKRVEESQYNLLQAIEELNQARDTLIFERKLLYALMESHSDRIFFKDTQLRYTKISREQAKALGLSTPAEAIGKTLLELAPTEESREITAAEQLILQDNAPLLAQTARRIDCNGCEYWESVSKAPLHSISGEIMGLVGIARDITKELALQTQLQQASKMEAIGRLAGGIAHDFNNLLQAIFGYTEILMAQFAEGTSECDNLRQIKDAADKAANLTHLLLAFSRKQRVTPKLVDLNQVVNLIQKMLRRLVGHTIEITLDLSEEIAPIMIDYNQMEQVIVNLTINARDAMPEGGSLTLQTHTRYIATEDVEGEPELQAGQYTCLTVIDCGTGISTECLPHIFEPFFTTKACDKGTGLGLSVVYGIIKQAKGWINAANNRDGGASFTICLPAATAQSTSGELT